MPVTPPRRAGVRLRAHRSRWPAASRRNVSYRSALHRVCNSGSSAPCSLPQARLVQHRCVRRVHAEVAFSGNPGQRHIGVLSSRVKIALPPVLPDARSLRRRAESRCEAVWPSQTRAVGQVRRSGDESPRQPFPSVRPPCVLVASLLARCMSRARARASHGARCRSACCRFVRWTGCRRGGYAGGM